MFSRILTKIRKFFCLTARDLGMQEYTVQEIAEMMKPGPVPEDLLPRQFAREMRELFAEEDRALQG
jgi:hypothetical protein